MQLLLGWILLALYALGWIAAPSTRSLPCLGYRWASAKTNECHRSVFPASAYSRMDPPAYKCPGRLYGFYTTVLLVLTAVTSYSLACAPNIMVALSRFDPTR